MVNPNLKNVLDSTYKSKSTSSDELKKSGYVFDNELSNINDRVYYRPDDKRLLISYRGTHNLLRDIPTDLSIFMNRLDKSKRYKEGKDTYNKAKEKYHTNATLVGHSLGGSLASEIAEADDRVYTYNKGIGHLMHKVKPNETAYRHILDPVSILSIGDTNTKSIGNITDNIFTVHKTDQLDKIDDIFV